MTPVADVTHDLSEFALVDVDAQKVDRLGPDGRRFRADELAQVMETRALLR